MPMKYVRVVPSSGAGSSLCSEIAQAFDRIRERAYTIYDSRLPDTPGSEFEDWLQAERDLFEVPDCNLQDEGHAYRLLLETEAATDRPLTIALEPGVATVMGHRLTDGEMCLFRRINLPEPVVPESADVVIRRGSGIEITMMKQEAAAASIKPKAMAAAVGSTEAVAA